MSEKFRQEMPPDGGYPGFNYRRTYAKALWRPGFIFALGMLNMVWCYFYNQGDIPKRKRTAYFQDRDLTTALEPFFLAERDRQVLRIMKKNHKIEKELMKNVPGWQVGTFYGEPIYYTLGDQWVEPIALESNIHLRTKDWHKNNYWRQVGPWPTEKWF